MKKASDDADGDAAPSGGKRKRMLLVVGSLVIAALAGKFVLGGGAPEASGAETTTTTAAPGPVEVLEPVTLMLADGRYLKLGIALQLHDEHAGAAGEEAKETDPRTKWAKGLDLVISALGRRTFPELVSPEGRDAAKRELTEQLRGAYPDVVEEIYFTEFVLQ